MRASVDRRNAPPLLPPRLQFHVKPASHRGARQGLVRQCAGQQLYREPPAEADFQRFFQVTPPTVHGMIVALERRGLISRVPRQPRTIRLVLAADELPPLQPIKITETGY